jgi:malate dehydrogenase (oxaloacetate-decarboxylating)
MSIDDRTARAGLPAAEALRLHARYRGKIQMAPKCPVRGPEDFAIWYSPGVAAPCLAVQATPSASYEQTNRGNTIAVVSDGTRVLGLGDIGPEAAMPVMEGKALLFKYLGGVDAIPLCLRTKDPDELVRALELLEPSFGGVNLEDIAQPKCFRVLEKARARLRIPVWHDDQQGTATVLLAGLLNALDVVGKRLTDARIVVLGAGAAGIAVVHLLRCAGVDPRALIVCDSRGVLHEKRTDVSARRAEFPEKWRLCEDTNASRVEGGIDAALRGADVCVAFSRPGPGLVRPEWIERMGKDPIVFACANPVPEIWPWEAHEAGARVVATGRGDFPNQLNNSLAFPGIFRGVLDVRARSVTDGMALAAARELAEIGRERGLSEKTILPRMEDPDLVPRLAAAVGLAAIREGIAQEPKSREQLLEGARRRIDDARAAADCWTRRGP